MRNKRRIFSRSMLHCGHSVGRTNVDDEERMGRFTPLGQLLVTGIIAVFLLIALALILTQYGQIIGCRIARDCIVATVEVLP